MLCQRCKKREAVIHFYGDYESEIFVKALCVECIQEINSEIEKEDKLEFSSVVKMIFDSVNFKKNKSLERCKSCGLTKEEFVSKGLVGCENCYEILSSEINRVIDDMQKGKEHRGKIPNKLKVEISRKKKIINLKKELEVAISIEAYEKAATLRDKIEELENFEKRGEEDGE